MPANTLPIFSERPVNSSDGLTAFAPTILAVGDTTGVAAGNTLVFTAGPDGAYIRKLRFKAAGTNVQTVGRIFLNNGLTNATAANNHWIGDMQLPATTLSANAPTGADYDYIVEAHIQAGFRLYVGLGTAVASGWVVTAMAGDF